MPGPHHQEGEFNTKHVCCHFEKQYQADEQVWPSPLCSPGLGATSQCQHGLSKEQVPPLDFPQINICFQLHKIDFDSFQTQDLGQTDRSELIFDVRCKLNANWHQFYIFQGARRHFKDREKFGPERTRCWELLPG